MSRITNQEITEALNNPNFSFIESFADAGDSVKITRELTILVFKHRQKREQLQEKERLLVRQEAKLKSLKSKAYLENKDAPNENTKRVLVDLATEEEEYQVNLTRQIVSDLKRDLASIKLEIDTFKSISYNLRTEMGSF